MKRVVKKGLNFEIQEVEVVFRHQGNFVFDVLILDPSSACERQFPVLDDEELHQKKHSISSTCGPRSDNVEKGLIQEECSNKKADRSFKSSGYPYFSTVVKSYCRKLMQIPTNFAEKYGIIRRWCDMILIDQMGRSWKVLLRHRRDRPKNHPYIVGWGSFHKDNDLKSGDQVIFELIDSGEKPVMRFYRQC